MREKYESLALVQLKELAKVRGLKENKEMMNLNDEFKRSIRTGLQNGRYEIPEGIC